MISAFITALFNSHQDVAPWIIIILGVFYILQVFISALIILCFCCNKGFRKKPGSIILFYAISAFGVSIIGGLEHYGSIGHDICASLGFLVLFFQYNCLYYEIGFIAFFIYDFEKLIKTKFQKPIDQARSRLSSRQGSRRNSFIDPSMMNSRTSMNLKTEEKADKKGQEEAPLNQREEPFENYAEREARIKEIQDRIDEKIKDIEVLVEKTQELKYNFSRSRLQEKINYIVIILSLTSALIPTFSKDLGPDMFGGCSDEFDPHQVKEIRMGFYLFVAATNAVCSALGLISFFKQKKQIEKKILKPLDRDFTQKEMKKIKHYLFDVFLFIAVTTLCCWVFSGLNIYAAITVLNNSNSPLINKWKEIKWDVLILLRLTQEMAVLGFKLMEPMVKKAIKETFGGCCRSLKGCCCKRKESLKREDRETEIKISLLDNETNKSA